jgi:phosphatidylinositol-3-phosphatase
MLHAGTPRAFTGAVALGAALLCGAPPSAAAASKVQHIFLIVLENESYEVTFAHDSAAPYLARTLTAQGVLLQNYYGVGHWSLDNYIALISGQAPNEATQDDCETFSEFHMSAPSLDAHGQALGVGCVYPLIVRTLSDELETAGLTWKAYMEDMGKDPARESATCAHSPINAPERLLGATVKDQYAVKHNPFVYFHSIIDDPARCDAHVVNLDKLTADLRTAAATPNYVFITPSLCHDGHDSPCVDGEPGGLISADAFLQKWVPQITSSAAFKKDGLLIITFDEADPGRADGSIACCGELGLAGARRPPGLQGPGGGRVGAVLISPFIRPGTISYASYNHYSLLRSVASLLGVAPLGFAAQEGLHPFGADVFNAR